MDIIKGLGEQSPLYVKNCWYVAAWCNEIDIHQMYAITIINKPVLIYRKENGELTAMADQCCHRHMPLSNGRLEGDDVRCMYHGLKFNAQGRCVEVPTMKLSGEDVPDNFLVPTYPVAEKHDWVWVWLGDPDKADEALIPATTGPDDPDWFMHKGHLDYDANYLLINDNLSDLGHIAYTHQNSFAGGKSDAYFNQPRVQMIDRGIRITRWNTNSPRRAYQKSSDDFFDQYMTYDFIVPGVLMMFQGMYKAGGAEACDFGTPTTEMEPDTASFTSQSVTPMTDGTSRYFFSWGPRMVEHKDNPDIVEGMWALANKAFIEDKETIETQQLNIQLRTGAPMVSIQDDRGPNMFRKMIDKMIAEEA
ncbi:MAG: aromatic ring-hydroxylating dioxygenase subunit alpha [Gammaproteobacteria bacterium]|jgi:vanillate O-demethylase monooxygenase subunit|nr:aromatic ring-hydroxylating dioxygenase subunit alpha [Gammaproteobacteria bacterium]